MKKLLALILSLALLCSALASCKPSETDGEEPTGEPTQGEEEPTEGEEEPTEGEEEPTEEPTERPGTVGGEIEETVLFDEKDVKITATELSYDGSQVELTLLLENNTDKSLDFLSGTLGYSANSINGWMVEDGYLNATVAPGKKSYETVYFDDATLALLGVADIADITLAVEIEDDSFDTYLMTGPMELKTSLADAYDYAEDTYRTAVQGPFPDAYDVELLTMDESAGFDAAGVRVLSQALLKTASGEYALFTELENTSDRDVRIVSQEFAVNGVLVEGSRWSSSMVFAGKKIVMISSLSDMTDKNIQKAVGLDKVGRVDYELELQDGNNEALADAQKLTLTVPGAEQNVDTGGEELYNENGIRIVSKGFVEDGDEYSDSVHLILLAENGSSADVTVGEKGGSVSINGFMSDCTFYRTDVPAGATAVLDVEFYKSYLDAAQVETIEDIEELELTLEIRDTNYNAIDSPTLKLGGQDS